MSKQALHPSIWLLSVTAFAIGVAEFIVVGVLPSIAASFDITIAKAGSLVGLYALALAIGTPICVLFFSRYPKKPVLLALITVFLLANIVAACATSYTMLLAARVVTAVAHGSFFAIGATVAAKLAPKGQDSRAIAIMFAGLTLAMVIGVPLGSVIGNMAGWQWPFIAVALLAAISLVASLRALPSIPKELQTPVKVQISALKSKAVLGVMLVTILGFGATFSAFTYVTPIMTDVTGYTSTTASILLVVFGAATFIGNLAGGSFAARFGWQKSLAVNLLLMVVVMAMLLPAMHNPYAMVMALFIWGCLAFALSPALQSAMLNIASTHAPRSIDFSSALNISAFNFGIALGEHAGGALVSQQWLVYTPVAGVVMALVAFVPLRALKKYQTASI
ncbi:MFS transporter [Vibrio parahaemolyticus]|nr:MFS transporter [Vibrio parahaemolyticus]